MWILPSRGRSKNILRLIDAYEKTGSTTPVWLRLDDDDTNPEYHHENWTVQTGPRLPLSEIYAEAYRKFPDSDWYGFIADDVVPITQNWDIKLIETAGHDGMAVPAGGDTTGGCPHFVLGGDLVRSIGWLALPGLSRLYIDTCWGVISAQRGVLRHVPEVILEHRHFSNKLALFDATYKKSPIIKENDKRLYERWLADTIVKISM